MFAGNQNRKWELPLERDIGGGLLDQSFHLSANGSWGGISLFRNNNLVSLTLLVAYHLSISAVVTSIQYNDHFLLTAVYETIDDAGKDQFLAKMGLTAPPWGNPWIILGDFNLILVALDRVFCNIDWITDTQATYSRPPPQLFQTMHPS